MLKYILKKIPGLSSVSIDTGESVSISRASVESDFVSQASVESDFVSHASPSTLTLKKHDVFLSFRGDDTRNNFTSHLNAALRRKQMEVYIDESEEKGSEISAALVDAIEGSKLAVVVFSVNYADSSWCLDELVHILRCKERHEMFVIPVFYRVDPSDVRKQKGDFAAALNRIRTCGKPILQEWTDALTAAANLSGWDSANIRTEAELVEIIVEDIIRKLRGKPVVDFKGLTGFPERLKVFESMLDIGSPSVRIVGIGGMSGIGKTTLAIIVYRRISFQFDACCFLANVRDEWKQGRGACYLQNQLMSELFPGENVQADNIYRIFDKNRLKLKKVLIVLDDVDEARQLDIIAGGRDLYGPGSRIILTSRDSRALDVSDAKFDVTGLSTDEALELFQWTAFETSTLTKDEIEWSKRVVRDLSETVFNPFALISLASTLCGKSLDRWSGILEKMKNRPVEEVHELLKQSYGELREEKKCIFLDIACFFNKENRDFAERILDGCGFSADDGIEDLIRKYLLNIVDFNKLWMQWLIEATGREIVLRESTEPGRRSRLWNHEDLCHVFKHNSETDTIQGIYVDMCGIKSMEVSPKVFKKMYNMRVLKFHNHFGKCTLMFGTGQLESLPEKLRYLNWDAYPFPCLPSGFTALYLVELRMQFSKLHKLWEGVQILDKLKVIDLSFSKQLIEIPNLSKAPNVESVCLRGCELVREVPQYFEALEQLKSLNLEDCSSLETVSALPRNIEHVNLTRCVSLWSLPNYFPESLDSLELAGCSSFDYTDRPEVLSFS